MRWYWLDQVWLPVAIANWNAADGAVLSTGFLWEKTGKQFLQRIDGSLHATRHAHVSDGRFLGVSERGQRGVQDQEQDVHFTLLSVLQRVELVVADDFGRFFVRVGDVLGHVRVFEPVLLRRSALHGGGRCSGEQLVRHTGLGLGLGDRARTAKKLVSAIGAEQMGRFSFLLNSTPKFFLKNSAWSFSICW